MSKGPGDIAENIPQIAKGFANVSRGMTRIAKGIIKIGFGIGWMAAHHLKSIWQNWTDTQEPDGELSTRSLW
jgi:hypothetical protein